MGKLWQKNYELNALVESFTVGRDYLLDQEILVADCLASMAHARMLSEIGVLTEKEAADLASGLKSIIRDFAEGRFSILPGDEDGHTAIENRLTKEWGEIGKKIHTGRSRNDQVITAIRVFARTAVQDIADEGLRLVRHLTGLAQRHTGTPMPGRTHTQIGMPSSVGLWAAAFAEELLDALRVLDRAWEILNQSPLGSAASYGVPLPLDRELTARLLGFSQVQRNVLYVNNSRGKFEAYILDALDQIGLTMSKMAQDLILFSLPEFGYFRLPASLCSGSSIMPQKKNPDGLELMRAKSATLGAYAFQVKTILRSLPSGYNRDFQETKEPFLRGLALAQDCLAVMSLTIRELEVDSEALAKGFTPDIYATDAAFELVAQGWSFRDAYKEIGLHLDRLQGRDPASTIKNRTHIGAAGNLGLDQISQECEVMQSTLDGRRAAIHAALSELAGEDVSHLAGL